MLGRAAAPAPPCRHAALRRARRTRAAASTDDGAGQKKARAPRRARPRARAGLSRAVAAPLVWPTLARPRPQITQREFTEKAWEAIVAAPAVAQSHQQQARGGGVAVRAEEGASFLRLLSRPPLTPSPPRRPPRRLCRLWRRST